MKIAIARIVVLISLGLLILTPNMTMGQGVEDSAPVDIVIVLDDSGSMADCINPWTPNNEKCKGSQIPPSDPRDLPTLDRARPIPRISIQAFCEEQASVEAMQAAKQDRRLAKSHVSMHMGGAQAAVRLYINSPTPNLIVIETTLGREKLL